MGKVIRSITGTPKPKPPPPPAPPPPPEPPPAREDAQFAAENQADMLRRRRGRASTILTDEGTGMGNSTSAPATAAAKLLGS